MSQRTGLSAAQRFGIVVAAIVVLVVGYLLLSGGGDDNSNNAATTGGTAAQSTTGGQSAPAVPTVRVVNAKPSGGVQKLNFKKGDPVRFRVVSDTADEIHVHGYDLMKDVPAGGSVSFNFKGSIDGRFVVELEDHGEQIAELDVAP